MKKQIQFVLVMSVLVLPFSAMTQSDDDKIIVEITKEVNGDKKTFKGEYNSTDEMKTDSIYQEFIGMDDRFDFWWGSWDNNMIVHWDSLKDSHRFFPPFYDNHEDIDNIIFHHHLKKDSSNRYLKRMKKLEIDTEELVRSLQKGDNRIYGANGMDWKKVKVTEVENEFGKKGRVDENSKLELKDLDFHPNPSLNGNLMMRFTVPSEDELSIKVFNLEDKEIYGRYFERFSGTYSDHINLSAQKEGVYLLEIMQGNKRLTKKIIIN